MRHFKNIPVQLPVVSSLIAWLCLAVLGGFFSCKKETAIEVGMPYHIKSTIFNKGAFQPVQPIVVTRIYFKEVVGKWFTDSKEQVDWGKFDRSLPGNTRLEMKEGDTTKIVWEIPKDDLER